MKRSVFSKVLLLISLLTLVGYGNLSNVYAESTRVQYLDVPYEYGSQSKYKMLDIYTFEDAIDLPVIIYVHGGAWRMGDKKNVDCKPDFFNDLGFIFVSINYRLIPDISFPDNVYDVAQAFSWVKSRIRKYGGDNTKIIVMGHSAGNHLATLVSTDKKYLNYYGKSLYMIKANIAVDTAAYDVTAKMSKMILDRDRFYKDAFGTDPETWAEASPINFVERGKGIPPMLLFYSDLRRGAVTYSFAAELDAAKIRVDVVGSLDDTHTTINTSIGEPGSVTTEAIISFLQSLMFIQ